MTSLGKGALIFFGGVLFGTAGIKALSSRDAKKAYTHCTAAALRAKKSVMETVTKVQENAEDIYAEAKQINLEREESENPVESEPEMHVVTESKKTVESEPEKTVESTEENEI